MQLTGRVHGRTIELDANTELPDGQPVSIIIQPLRKPGDGIKRSAGSWQDAGPEIDEWLKAMQEGRQRDRI
jgi:hypothetical protein